MEVRNLSVSFKKMPLWAAVALAFGSDSELVHKKWENRNEIFIIWSSIEKTCGRIPNVIS